MRLSLQRYADLKQSMYAQGINVSITSDRIKGIIVRLNPRVSPNLNTAKAWQSKDQSWMIYTGNSGCQLGI